MAVAPEPWQIPLLFSSAAIDLRICFVIFLTLTPTEMPPNALPILWGTALNVHDVKKGRSVCQPCFSVEFSPTAPILGKTRRECLKVSLKVVVAISMSVFAEVPAIVLSMVSWDTGIKGLTASRTRARAP